MDGDGAGVQAARRFGVHSPMALHLLQTEPDDYSWDDLERDGGTVWDGVSNPAACKQMRRVRPGDEALLYHTGSEKRIVGLAHVTSEPYEDPKHPGENSRGEIARPVFDIEPVKPASKEVTLADLKADDRFAEFALLTQPRLSVMPVPANLAKIIRRLAGL